MSQGLTIDEQKQLVNHYRGLLRDSKNILKADDLKLIKRVFKDMANMYQFKRRITGEPYIFHLVDVARICVKELGLGTTAIVASMLHEVITDKFLNIIEIEKRYGANIAQIVQDLTKISTLDPKEPGAQAENFRELIISLANDARVILIKLADRLENMRSLDNTPEDFKLKKSWETFHLYAPLAHRLGLYRIKSELEDLAMKYTNTQEYYNIVRKLKNTTSRRNKFIKEFIKPIQNELCNRGFKFEVKGRPKSVYSIWKKMSKQEVTFENVYDVFAIRIILNSAPENEKSDCWQVYSIITDWWTPNPERLRDWISVPKSNGYESLHTTVVGPEGKWVEVQIRTKRMDEVAERGLAAHWKYKGIKQDQGLDQWLGRIRDMLETPVASAEEFVDQFKLNLYQKEVFAFTPNGDLKKFPLGATVLDFAFEIHSNLGCQCVGAKVNGKNVPIKHQLNNGDVVEVITSKNQKPKGDWLQIVKTSKAKGKIKQSIREDKNKQLTIGKELLYRRLKNWKVTDTDLAVKTLCKQLKVKNSAALFELISNEKVDLADYKGILIQSDKPQTTEEKDSSTDQPAEIKKEPDTISSDYLLIDEKLVNIEYKLAKCCKPIFGDNIFGFVTINEGIKIHRVNCPNAAQLHDKYGYRVVKARWKESSISNSFQTTIRVSGFDELGMVNKISELISKDLKVNMRAFSMSSSNGMFEGRIQVFVSDTKHLDMLLYRLGKIKGIQKAVRVNSD